jgi:N-carbamoylputrescine amidase
MRVTVCELSDEPDGLRRDWDRLAAHVQAESSDLVLLPEMPFSPWFALAREFDPAVWDAAVAAHEGWLARLPELAPATVLGSRPVNEAGRRLNEGFTWEAQGGYRRAHVKYHLPDEEGFWEASWYDRGDGRFTVSRAGAARVGFMICTDLWFLQHAREYGRAGAHLVASPRATPAVTVDKWLAGGRVAAVVSGAFSLSSNRSSAPEHAVAFGGLGWIVGPDGEVLGTTSRERPMVTLEIDLAAADRAKRTYPRYVAD